jgi:hypothetical protein
MIHGDHAKQMIISFGDGFSWPVAIHITNSEVF